MDNALVNARSTIVWILAIVVSFAAVWWIERESGRELIAASAQAGAAPAPRIEFTSDSLESPQPRALEAREQQWARTAWSYFENNTDARTGLAGSVEGFPSGTLWDEGSYLMAVLAAERLGIVDAATADARIARALASLRQLPLTDAGLPNKAYDVRTLAMTDYRGQPSQRGIGVSAIDLARLAAALQAIVWRHPQQAGAVRDTLAHWRIERLSRDGELTGWSAGDGASQPVQEGRIGYEQYAAEALAPLHLELAKAADWRAHLRWVRVEGIDVPVDSREGAAVDAVVSEPYVLEGLEFGWSRVARELAWRVYEAQQARHSKTGVATAVSEDHLDRAPYFAYDAVYAHGKPWAVLSSEGEELQGKLRTLSVKAAFGWHALLRTQYTAQLVEKVSAVAQQPGKGWAAGIYEADGQPNRAVSCNTNAVVLESLAYIAGGPVGGWK